MVLIDEVSMLDIRVLQCIDQQLQIITGVSTPFGDKHVILGGDKAQLVPPVGSKYSIFNSNYMELFYHIELKQQMRQTGDHEFLAWLRKVGFQ